MYKATKQWQLNRFINLFVMEGVLYFILYVFILYHLAPSLYLLPVSPIVHTLTATFLDSMLGWNIINTLYAWGNFSPVGWQIIFVGFVEAVPIATMAPRFVLNVRELYARNIRGERGDGIDTGFGLSGLSGNGTSRSAMVFADSGRSEGLEHNEEMSMEERAA
jgi:hypothetical protein